MKILSPLVPVCALCMGVCPESTEKGLAPHHPVVHSKSNFEVTDMEVEWGLRKEGGGEEPEFGDYGYQREG